MANYNVQAIAGKTKVKEVNLDCFGIKKINFELGEVEESGLTAAIASNVELTEEQVRFLQEHDFICEEINSEP